MCRNCVNNYFDCEMKNKNYLKINIPRLIQRANDIVVACYRDKCELTVEGLPWELVRELAEMVPVVSDIDMQYRLQKQTNSLSTSDLKEFIQKSIELRTLLAEDIRMALEFAGVNYKLEGKWKNRTQTQIVQDLNDLAVLARIYHNELSKTNFNFDRVNLAACTSKELSMVITALELDREIFKSIDQSNRYTMLNNLYSKMKVICRYGRKAFAKQPARRLPYRAII